MCNGVRGVEMASEKKNRSNVARNESQLDIFFSYVRLRNDREVLPTAR